jgi:hypothetical protein
VAVECEEIAPPMQVGGEPLGRSAREIQPWSEIAAPERYR